MLMSIRSVEGVQFCLIMHGAFASNLTSKNGVEFVCGMCIVLTNLLSVSLTRSHMDTHKLRPKKEQKENY